MRRRSRKWPQVVLACACGVAIFSVAVFRGIPDADRFHVAENAVAWVLAGIGAAASIQIAKRSDKTTRATGAVALALIIIGMMTLMTSSSGPTQKPEPPQEVGNLRLPMNLKLKCRIVGGAPLIPGPPLRGASARRPQPSEWREPLICFSRGMPSHAG